MIRTKKDQYVDEVFRKAYGQEYTWDSANNTLGKRYGVGTIEDGPSNPKVTIPTGKVAQKVHEKVEIPAAVAPSSVARADLGFDDAFSSDTLTDSANQKSALTKARAYIASKS